MQIRELPSKIIEGFVRLNVRPFIFTVLLVSSTASASYPSVANLKGIKPCYSSNSVQINGIDTLKSKTIANLLYKILNEKMTAYRIPGLSCDDNFLVGLQVDVASSGENLSIYVVDFSIYALSLLPQDGVVIYSRGRFGSSAKSSNSLDQTLKSTLSEMIDQFASDYVKANP